MDYSDQVRGANALRSYCCSQSTHSFLLRLNVLPVYKLLEKQRQFDHQVCGLMADTNVLYNQYFICFK